MGKLKDAVSAKRRVGMACAVSVMRLKLSEADKADFDEVIRDLGIPATVIAEQLQTLFGIDIGTKSLNRHRRKMLGRPGCQCIPT